MGSKMVNPTSSRRGDPAMAKIYRDRPVDCAGIFGEPNLGLSARGGRSHESAEMTYPPLDVHSGCDRNPAGHHYTPRRHPHFTPHSHVSTSPYDAGASP